MKKFFLVSVLFLTVFGATGCALAAVNPRGTAEPDFPGYISLELDGNSYDLNSPVLAHLNYGHAYEEGFNEHGNVMSNRIEVFVVESMELMQLDPSEVPMFFQITYEGDDVGSEDYRCTPASGWLAKTQYAFTEEVEMDFSTLEMDDGVLIALFTERYDPVGPTQEATRSQILLLSFEISGDKVTFAKPSFNALG